MSRSGFRTGPRPEAAPRAAVRPDVAASHVVRRAPSGVADSLPPNHHLWRNGRRWWIAIVLVAADGRRHRVRRSLGTADVVVARHRRDVTVARIVKARHWRPASEGLAAAAPPAADDRGHPVLDGVAA